MTTYAWDLLADAVTARVLAYSDDEERDDHGRWSSGGGEAIDPKPLTDRELKSLPGEANKTSLTSTEATTVFNYTRGQNGPINAQLRGGPNPYSDNMVGPHGVPYIGTPTEAIKALDSAMEKSPGLPHDSVLYRGTSWIDKEQFSSLRPGDTFVDKGFVSTSGDRDIGRGFGFNGLQWELHVPQGTPALSGHTALSEAILDRGLTYRVMSRDEDTLRVQVIKPSAKAAGAYRPQAYSPDQERDEHGRFGSGGGGDAVSRADSDKAIDALPTRQGLDFDSVLTKEEGQAVTAYVSGGAQYSELQTALRSGRELSAESKQLVERLDNVLSKSTLPSEATVYRGLHGEFAERLAVGDTLVDHGYVSTTTDAVFAGTVANLEKDFTGRGGAVVRVNLPAGQHGFRGMGYGREVVLPCGQAFKITGTFDTGRDNVKGLVAELHHEARARNLTPKTTYSTWLAVKRALNYSEDEERDDHGRWSSGGGDSGGEPKSTVEYADLPAVSTAAGFTSEEVGARDTYSRFSGAINGYLRDPDKAPTDYQGRAVSREAIEARVKALDSAMEKSTIPRDAVLWRGVGEDMLAHLQPGVEFVEHGYTSTSTSRDVAEGFAKNVANASQSDKHVLVEIQTPAGSNAIRGARAESEVLLARGGRFQVVGTRVIPGLPKTPELRYDTRTRDMHVITVKLVK